MIRQASRLCSAPIRGEWRSSAGVWAKSAALGCLALMLFWGRATAQTQPPSSSSNPPANSSTNSQDDSQKIPPLKQSITVTEKISADAPASIDVLSSQKLEQTPGV